MAVWACLGIFLERGCDFLHGFPALLKLYPVVSSCRAADQAAGEAVCLQPKDAVRDAHRSKWFPGDWTDDTDQLVCVLRCHHQLGTNGTGYHWIMSCRFPDYTG